MNLKPSTIDLVTYNGVFNTGHMDTDLVGTSGFKLQANMGVFGKALQYPIVGARLFAITHHAISPAAGGVCHGLVNEAAAGHGAGDHRFIFTADCPRLQLGNQVSVGRGFWRLPSGRWCPCRDGGLCPPGNRFQLGTMVQKAI